MFISLATSRTPLGDIFSDSNILDVFHVELSLYLYANA
jgi:hypothetical protein